MSKRRNDSQPQGERWQRPAGRKPYVSADEIIRRAMMHHRIDLETVIYEVNLNRPNRNKEMIERLVTGIKNHHHYSAQPYTDEGWY